MSSHTLLEGLQSRGFRLTRARTALIDILMTETRPVSVADIRARLVERGQRVDKVTVYRDIDLLVEQGFVIASSFRDRVLRYEIAAREHHHHVVCEQCSRVEDVVLPEQFEAQERLVAERTHFRIRTHSLEFFGLCQDCQL